MLALSPKKLLACALPSLATITGCQTKSPPFLQEPAPWVDAQGSSLSLRRAELIDLRELRPSLDHAIACALLALEDLSSDELRTKSKLQLKTELSEAQVLLSVLKVEAMDAPALRTVAADCVQVLQYSDAEALTALYIWREVANRMTRLENPSEAEKELALELRESASLALEIRDERFRRLAHASQTEQYVSELCGATSLRSVAILDKLPLHMAGDNASERAFSDLLLSARQFVRNRSTKTPIFFGCSRELALDILDKGLKSAAVPRGQIVARESLELPLMIGECALVLELLEGEAHYLVPQVTEAVAKTMQFGTADPRLLLNSELHRALYASSLTKAEIYFRRLGELPDAVTAISVKGTRLSETGLP